MAQEMSEKKWVFLVAGSKGWENYKHQANVCCLYQIIKKHGIPDEQIVVMMYDDIAFNLKNPEQGSILSVVDQSNVYSQVPKDYTREDLTPENFLAALQGHNTMNKKVIKSGINDNIYIFMSGLGTEEGTFEFPEKSLHQADFIGAIKNMSDENKFSKMVIYMDSSYSATMLNALHGVEVFGLASCTENIEATPYDYDKTRDVFLSDKFAHTWLKYLHSADFATEQFKELVTKKQSKFLKENPDQPCPCRFGNKEIANCYLSEFLQN